MRKIPLIFGCLFGSLACVAADPFANLNFEKGADCWAIDGRKWRIADGCGRKGSRALCWENENPDFSGYAICKIPVEGGCSYRIGGWMKVERFSGAEGECEPKIGYNFVSAGGKWLGCGQTHQVVENLANSDGWRYYECKTRALPGEAGFINILCSANKGAKGKAYFDDFSFRKEGADLVGPMTTSRYRDEGNSGAVRVAVLLRVNTVKHPLETLDAVFCYQDAKGRSAERPAETFSAGSATVTLDIGDLRSGCSPIAFELRTKPGKASRAAKLGENALVFTKGNLPRRRVSFDEYNRTIVDGKPFFPLGMYSSAKELGELFFARYCEAGFNCVMPYSAPTREKLDEAWKAGVRVVYNVQGQIFGTPYNRKHYRTPQAVKAWLGRTVNAVKDHPAVLAWYVNDECPEDDRPVLEDACLTLHCMDEDHPTWAVTDKPWHARPFLGTYDVIGMDPYPIGNGRGGIEICTTWANEAFEGTFRTKPMWQVPQAFNWAWYRPGEKNPGHRNPTVEELENMTWQAIAAGANGLVYYSFDDLFGKQDARSAERLWADLKVVAGKVKARFPILLSVPDSVPGGFPEGVNARSWRTESGETWILAVNTTRRKAGDFAPLEARFVRAGTR